MGGGEDFADEGEGKAIGGMGEAVMEEEAPLMVMPEPELF